MNTRPIYALLVVAAAVGGCKSSDRQINMPDGEVLTGPTQQIQPIGSMPFAVSANGAAIAVATPAARPRDFNLEVRDLATMKVRRSWLFKESERFPVLLTRDGSGLIVAETTPDANPRDSLWLYDVATGGRRPLPGRLEGNLAILGRNHAHTILAERNSLLVTVSGKTHRPPQNASILFDEKGNAWYQSGETWTRITPDGVVSRGAKPPYLVSDPTLRKGSWRLVGKQTTLTYKHSEARITTIWLENSKAVPYPVQKGSIRRKDESHRAGLVYSGPDVFTYGFIPNRDLIYVVTADGSYLVPFGKHKARVIGS